MNFEDLLGKRAGAEVSDRTVYTRESAYGVRRDWEVRETTCFNGAFPEERREVRYGQALPCGHHVGGEGGRRFGGYCQAEHADGVCGLEYCDACAFTCSACGQTCGRCCVNIVEGVEYCSGCARRRRFRSLARGVALVVMRPFVEP